MMGMSSTEWSRYMHDVIGLAEPPEEIDDEVVRRLLARYEERNARSQCHTACGGCQSACPEGVPIADVLRTRMYAEDYGDADFARREYALLEGSAAACASCSHQACASSCPFGIPIPELTRPLHGWLG